MTPTPSEFNKTAVSLARNPLGIIALFIVLVYGFACLVLGISRGLEPAERLPLIYFVVIFPVLVLAVFAWLVAYHSTKLFAPTDYRDDKSFLQALHSAAPLIAAQTKSGEVSTADEVREIATVVRKATEAAANRDQAWRVLWVDDRPENNVYERQALEAIGIKFDLSLNTEDALRRLSSQRYSLVISDMGRREGPREGYALLDKMRGVGDGTPLIFYASSASIEHRRKTKEHGGQGCTNSAQELYQMVVDICTS